MDHPLASEFDHSGGVEGGVLGVGDVAELVGEALGGADGGGDVAVGVAIDPVVDARGGDVVAELDGESAVDGAAFEVL